MSKSNEILFPRKIEKDLCSYNMSDLIKEPYFPMRISKEAERARKP